MAEFTTIKVFSETRDQIANEGKYNESMADIVKRMVQEWKECKKERKK